MPLYEFFCKECNKHFEEIISVEKLPLCPTCNTKHVQRILSATHVKSKCMPFKPGPVHPIAKKQLASTCSMKSCSTGFT